MRLEGRRDGETLHLPGVSRGVFLFRDTLERLARVSGATWSERIENLLSLQP